MAAVTATRVDAPPAGLSPGRLRALLGVLVVLQLARTVARTPDEFSRSYLTVDYRAGFLRRGLAGEVLHLLAGTGPGAVTAAGVLVAAVPTLAVLVLLEALVRRRSTAAATTAVLLAASPFVLDQLWLHRRPDQLGLAVLVVAGLLVTGPPRWRTPGLAGCGLAFGVLALVHEGTWLYGGTVAVALVVVVAGTARERLARAALVGVPGAVVVLAVGLVGAATPAQVAVLQATTRPTDRGSSVLFYLGDDVGTSVARVAGFDHGQQLVMLALGAALVAGHAWWLRRWAGGDLLARARAVLPRAWSLAVLAVLGASVALTFATGTDWVRWVCGFGAAWLCASAVVVLERDRPGAGAPVVVPPGLVLVALYLAALGPLREQLGGVEALTSLLPVL